MPYDGCCLGLVCVRGGCVCLLLQVLVRRGSAYAWQLEYEKGYSHSHSYP